MRKKRFLGVLIGKWDGHLFGGEIKFWRNGNRPLRWRITDGRQWKPKTPQSILRSPKFFRKFNQRGGSGSNVFSGVIFFSVHRSMWLYDIDLCKFFFLWYNIFPGIWTVARLAIGSSREFPVVPKYPRALWHHSVRKWLFSRVRSRRLSSRSSDFWLGEETRFQLRGG